MAKCPYCNTLENDYNSIIHYPEKLDYFVKHAKYCICFDCSKTFIITASSNHFYDKLIVKYEDFNKIIKQYYNKDALEYFLPNNNIKKLYLYYLKLDYVELKNITTLLLLKEYLKYTKDIDGNTLKKDFLNLSKNLLHLDILHSFLNNYNEFITKKTINLSYSHTEYFKILCIIFIYQYKNSILLKNLSKKYKNDEENLKKEINDLFKNLKYKQE